MKIKHIADILLTILFIIFVSFLYFGITNRIAISSDYNVPIAESILTNTLFRVPPNNLFLYSPGASHVILSFFLLLGFPNLFGVLSWICLFIVCKKLGKVFGLNKYMAFIFASSVCTTASVVRTISDQSIDKWLCIWFILSVILLEKFKDTWKYALIVGFSLGMLIGTKYSGPLFFISFLLIYGKKLFTQFKTTNLVLSFISFSFFGLFWYIKNIILKGNPYYPANLFFFKGYPGFTQQDWQLWKIPFEYPNGIIPLINSFISEYMIWAFSGLIIGWYIYSMYRAKKRFDGRILRVIKLSFATAAACLFLPITPARKVELFHLVSDMRYIYIFVVIMMLAVFIIADKYKKNTTLALASLLNTIPIFPFIAYQPKLFIMSILLFFIVYSKKQKIIQRIIG